MVDHEQGQSRSAVSRILRSKPLHVSRATLLLTSTSSVAFSASVAHFRICQAGIKHELVQELVGYKFHDSRNRNKDAVMVTVD